MPEGANVEIAKHLNEHGGHNEGGHSDRYDRILEIVRGYPAGLRRDRDRLERLPVGADGTDDLPSSTPRPPSCGWSRIWPPTQAGQQLLFNTNNLDAWIPAATTGDDEAAADVLPKRFTPNYQIAFEAWLDTEPLTDPRTLRRGRSSCRSTTARSTTRPPDSTSRRPHAFERGRGRSRDTGEDYVRVTVFLAMVLFLIAMSQRFKIRNVRHRTDRVWRVVFTGLALGMILSLPAPVARRLAGLAVGLPRPPSGGPPEVDDLRHRRHEEQLPDQHLHDRERLPRVARRDQVAVARRRRAS